MREIGIRELRQHASRYLRAVEGGETIEVTDRGRPIALLVPIPAEGGLDALVESGRVAPARGDALALGEPIPPAAGAPLPSDELERLRADER
jgi:prevent-host-death family protein